MLSLTVYDGATGIGGNKLYLEEGGHGVFLDFGKNFGKYGAIYYCLSAISNGLVSYP